MCREEDLCCFLHHFQLKNHFYLLVKAILPGSINHSFDLIWYLKTADETIL